MTFLNNTEWVIYYLKFKNPNLTIIETIKSKTNEINIFLEVISHPKL